MLTRYLGEFTPLNLVVACNNSLKFRQCNNFLDVYRAPNRGLEMCYHRFLKTQNSEISDVIRTSFQQYESLKF
jgi:hypothetical protein